MGNIHRVIQIFLLVVPQGIIANGKPAAGQMMHKNDPISAFSKLKTTLSKLSPIEHWEIATTPDAMLPFAPRFCWAFFRPDPDMLAQLGEGLRNYKGAVNWILGPPSSNAPICLIAAKQGVNQFIGYPQISGPEALSTRKGTQQESMPSEEFIGQALADIPNLCSHLERYLKLEDILAKSFDPNMVAPDDPPSPESVPFDFVERGMHVAWIIRDGAATGSGARRMLHFSVAEDEWRMIHAQVLVDVSTSSGATQTESVSFPLLSRISTSESAYFAHAEAVPLREECLRARAKTSNLLAIRGLDKLIMISDWAHLMVGDILLRAP